MRNMLIRLLLVVAVFGFTGCAGLHWTEAQVDHTREGYQSFRTAYPDDPRSKEAAAWIEEFSWREASGLDTPEAYRKFAEAFPTSKRCKSAMARAKALERDAGKGPHGRQSFVPSVHADNNSIGLDLSVVDEKGGKDLIKCISVKKPPRL